MHPDQIQATLSRHFGHPSLRPAQEEALEPILAGRDAVIVMPTGAGKSLCYQLPALGDRKGLTIVVSPLISLMKDQVDAMLARGIEAATINSSLPPEEARATYDAIARGRLRLLYVSPERLGHGGFLELIGRVEIRRVAIDEAHCVSQWGHDFRPDYLRIADFLDRIGRPQTIALTATATPRVRRDIAAVLRLREPVTVVTGFDRPGLSCRVERVRGSVERDRLLVDAIRTRAGQGGAQLVYVGSRKNADRAAAALRGAGLVCEVYHAGLGAAERTAVQDAFMSGRCRTVVATNAFGMGIDRSDVRLVLHYDLPGSLEAYYQEIGRAGRDGKPADAILLFSEASVRLQEFFIKRAHPTPDLVRSVHGLLCDAAEEGVGTTLEAIEGLVDDRELAPQVPAAVNRLIAMGLVRRGASGELQADLRHVDRLDDGLDIEGMAARREADEGKLAAVLRYARHRRCRRNVILEYFEAERDGDTCGRCDVCEGAVEETAELDDEALIVLRKILSGVARARGHAGRKKIIGMLNGSTAKGIGDSWLAALSTYGILKDMAKDRLDSCITAALDGGLIASQGDRYPTLEITRTGIAVLKGEAAPALAWPAVSRRAASRTGSPVRPAAGAANLAAADLDLAEQLQAWRRERARQDGVPAYVVFGNRTIEDLLATRPQALGELESVHGLGPARIAKYGEEILALFAAC